VTDTRTPIEKLDDAVREYVRDCGETGHVTSWALAIETSELTADTRLMPLGFSTTLVLGPATSPSAAVGLLEVGSEYARTHAMPEDEDPDD
jgi:hypothetical protein